MLNKYTHLPKRSPILYISFILIMLAYLTHAYMTEASASFQNYPYGVPPTLYKNCEQKWIGTEYHPLPTCNHVWAMLSREMLLEESDYFTSLSM